MPKGGDMAGIAPPERLDSGLVLPMRLLISASEEAWQSTRGKESNEMRRCMDGRHAHVTI
jgi:hypothetical protein